MNLNICSICFNKKTYVMFLSLFPMIFASMYIISHTVPFANAVELEVNWCSH
jgi:hypothetical protein